MRTQPMRPRPIPVPVTSAAMSTASASGPPRLLDWLRIPLDHGDVLTTKIDTAATDPAGPWPN